MKKLLLLVSLVWCSVNAFSQGEIPVDMHTGQPSIVIPIWQIQDYDISTPVSLAYDPSGMKMAENGADFGLGWNLLAAGSVSRQVRGLPDDFKGTGSDGRNGWFFSTSAAQASGFPNKSDLTTNCTDQQTD